MADDPANRLIRRGRRTLSDNVPLMWWVIGIVVVPVVLFVGERMWPKPEPPGNGLQIEEGGKPGDIEPGHLPSPAPSLRPTDDDVRPGDDLRQATPEHGEEATQGPPDSIAAYVRSDASREDRWAAYCAQDNAARFDVATAAGAALAELIEWRRSQLLGRANYGCVLISPSGQEAPYTDASALEDRLCWVMRCPE